jgi:ABC-type glycerol-3-phosphate transport system substrate-binding protein
MPAGPSGPSSPLITVNGIYLNPNSTNKEAALEVVNFLTGQVAQQTFANYGNYLPARTDIQGGNELLEAVSGGIVSGVAVPQNEGFSNYWLPFEKMFAQVLNGDVSPQQGLDVACAEMNAYNNK